MSYDKLPGFSLIEMAIVLIIIGLISGFSMSMLKGMLNSQKAKVTSANQEKILYSLASYAQHHKILPYAADPTNPTGKEDSATHRRRGIVPYSDLGLPESDAKDGYQRWFTYIVDDYYAETPQMGLLGSISKLTPNRLCETHGHPNQLRVKGLQDTIALALISHGAEGRGAYPHPLNPPPMGEDEYTNTTSDQDVIDRPISFDKESPFSHKVSWVTSRNLLAIYGHAPCQPVHELVPQSGGTHYQVPQFDD